MYSVNFQNVAVCLRVGTLEFSRSSSCIKAFGLFAICSLIIFKIFDSLEEVLEALTSAGEERKIDRFSSIVEGLRHDSVQLQVGFMCNPLYCFVTFKDEALHIL